MLCARGNSRRSLATDSKNGAAKVDTRDSEQADVIFSVRGKVGFILLNRPRALNALTGEMCRRVRERLVRWAGDSTVEAVVVEGEGEKAFCAGGDVVQVARSARDCTDDWWQFFFHEYRMNSAIKHFPKPYVALLDGVTMGGGVGISVHGNYRVATERTLLAMPETGLGLIPDVGGSYVLSRLPGATGTYLALSGYRAKAADCCYLGLATHYVPSDRLTELKATATEVADPLDIARTGVLLDDASEDPGPAPLAEHREAIDKHFGQDSVQSIIESLAADPSDWAQRTHDDLLTKSPTSMLLSFAALRRGAALDLDDCLKMEYRIVNRIMTMDNDFFEGVRAILVDKDRKPHWRPERLADVSSEDIEAHFEDLGEGELGFADTVSEGA